MTLNAIDSKLSYLVNSTKFSAFMLLCLFGYALLKSASRVNGDVFQSFFVFGTLLALYVERKHIFKDKMLISLFLALILQILSWINATIQIPQLAQATPDFGTLANMFFFIFIAYWLKGQSKSVYLLWVMMIIGFILSFYIHSNNFTQDLLNGSHGQRIDFNVNNAQHPALWSGIAFILLSYFSIKHSYLAFTTNKKKKHLLIVSGLTALNLFFVFILFSTQTRQVFLGLIIASIIGTISYVLIQKNKPSLKLILPLILVSLIALFSVSNIPSLEKRTVNEENTYEAVLSGDINKVPYNSSGIRIHIWYEALGWIKERPILGSDQDVRDDVIYLSTRIPKHVRNTINHLHNSFVEVTLSYGILGLAIILFMFYWLLHSTAKLAPLGTFNEARLIALLFLVYWFVVNNFESYLFSTTGLLVHNIMFGSIYTFYLTEQLKNNKNETAI
ncbi:O-antigen ligase family protein [Aliivibrio sp. S3MY1]|uniref:O-antigen ligase family protein n=1 Tax=unclassified Aliivibrio TaxID=2645654 RepID=UPI0023783B7D|nr:MULTISPECIES: O-antigen ligase family protein [unclassified Aliivibrio]MDD9196680.1 O-antigen ligase family protein [Aliivibrio sp. S3MY1]MDD9199829.1 O-antigen ligase family protein [Aliivibrio sp. S2MY1]